MDDETARPASGPTGAEPVSREEFHEFFAGLDYPMYVVTAAAGAERSGCLVGFGTQTSIEPPRLLVCVSVANHTHGVAERSPVLGVHLLDEGQRELAAIFGEETGDQTDKFAQCAWRPGPHGVPLLDDPPRRVVGRVLARHPMGDHTGFLLAPFGVEGGELDPLMFSDVADLDPGHPA